MRKLLCVILSVLLAFSALCLTGFAAEEEQTERAGAYPYIFVHGMGAWGSYEDFYQTMPYWGGWGGNADSDIIRIFNENGIEAYAASVGPVNSAWDRACELYAQLTGTVVDYGEAHSKAHNHDRYGFSYEGNQLMDEVWDVKSKLNLVGHSFGVPAVRLLASLLAYGDEDELAASGEDASELFKGGHDDVIHAVVSLAGPHNGSPIANYVYDAKGAMEIIGVMANLTGAVFGNNFVMWGLQMGHFGLTPKQGEKRAKLDISKAISFAKAQDNCGYDLTIRGARELNEKIKLVPSVYYYSYTSIATTTNSRDNEIPVSSMFILFKPFSFIIGRLEGKTLDGLTFDKSWEINDGIVPYASQLYPATDADTAKSYSEAIAASEEILPGAWYYMDPMIGFDHFDYCGTVDYPTDFEDFYFTLARTVDSRA